MHTEQALLSDDFLTLERSLVESVVKRGILKVKEVDLFKAVDRWATKELDRQGKTPSRKINREILGEEIVKAIRFSLIPEKEFTSVVLDCDILTKTEICDMIKYYNEVDLKSPLASVHSPRTLRRCCRFAEINFSFFAAIGDRTYALKLTVKKPVRLHGVQHFGSEGSNFTVSLELKDAITGFSLAQKSGSYFSVEDDTYAFYGFDVKFDNPVCLESNRTYEIIPHIQGPAIPWFGEGGEKSVYSQEVLFSFSNSAASDGGTNVSRGQFPSFLFSTM